MTFIPSPENKFWFWLRIAMLVGFISLGLWMGWILWTEPDLNIVGRIIGTLIILFGLYRAIDLFKNVNKI